MQPVNCRRRIRGVQVLRNQKVRRIHQPTVVNRQSPTERRLEAKTQADGVTPAHSQILRVHIFDEISRWRDRFRMHDVADAPKDIAAIVERHDLDVRRDGYPRFQVQDDHRIAANRHGEWINADNFPR